MASIGLLAVAITWRNLTHERLVLDAGHQRIEIQQVNKEIQQLAAQVQTEVSYAKISKWVRERHGRWSHTDRVNTVTIAESELTPKAREEARLIGALIHE